MYSNKIQMSFLSLNDKFTDNLRLSQKKINMMKKNCKNEDFANIGVVQYIITYMTGIDRTQIFPEYDVCSRYYIYRFTFAWHSYYINNRNFVISI